MNETIPIPKEITNQLSALNSLVQQYPVSLPVTKIAEFLGCDGESVRAYLMMPYSFGMGWQKDRKANRGFYVPTAKFYLWYRNITEIRKEA